MLNVFVSEIGLNSSCIDAVGGKLEAFAVPEHVRMNREFDAGNKAGASDDLVNSVTRKGTAALRGEDERRLGIGSAKFSKGANFIAFQEMNRRGAVFEAADMEETVVEIELFPAEVDKFTNAQTVAIADEDEESVSGAVTAGRFGGVNQQFDFIQGQVFARALFSVGDFGRRGRFHFG